MIPYVLVCIGTAGSTDQYLRSAGTKLPRRLTKANIRNAPTDLCSTVVDTRRLTIERPNPAIEPDHPPFSTIRLSRPDANFCIHRRDRRRWQDDALRCSGASESPQTTTLRQPARHGRHRSVETSSERRLDLPNRGLILQTLTKLRPWRSHRETRAKHRLLKSGDLPRCANSVKRCCSSPPCARTHICATPPDLRRS